ncbi:hypothetical protein FJT64_005110 [Amphibalanus amphitrite]|uniref:Uncharacterized protein n=1 Tax=Amphibalanus amphitrite TaxID=1232801 RepID=A0A6A4W5W7_AMPAM|nr:hypothetical protein FJT64_005110 [Amphibalanus amphitrite]
MTGHRWPLLLAILLYLVFSVQATVAAGIERHSPIVITIVCTCGVGFVVVRAVRWAMMNRSAVLQQKPVPTVRGS